jgi:pimeloyl-ACP methyl ester carboxylesterase
MVNRIVGPIAWMMGLLIVAPIASAKPHELHVQLHDGKLRIADLSAEILDAIDLPTTHLPGGEINLNGLGGSLFISAMNKSLGDGCRLEVGSNELIVHVDADKLPQTIDSTKRAIRVFTATAAPDATAAQARNWGLLLPAKVDTNRPLVILVHGLDGDHFGWQPIADLLTASGYQVAYFDYPNDGPIADDAALLATHMTALHETFPQLRLNIITFSMGALVARDYIEGPGYLGGVDHLIMLAPPNHGSSWARLHILSEWKEHIDLAMGDSHWSPTWMITDGLGEAGRDLTPDSKFLGRLNTFPRRQGVRYTIIDGNRNILRRWAVDSVKETEALIPSKPTSWSGFRECRAELADLARDIDKPIDKSDGPVSLASASLSGVSDVVTLHADHESLCEPHGKLPPAAWETIADRLAH